MKATLTTKRNDGKILSNRKERHFQQQYSVIVNGVDYTGKPSFENPIILRIYGTGAKNYACLWVNDRKTDTYVSGGGNADGYGFHRASQAAENAIRNARINLSESIGGMGDNAIESSLKAIAKALGYRKMMVHKAHA